MLGYKNNNTISIILSPATPIDLSFMHNTIYLHTSVISIKERHEHKLFHLSYSARMYKCQPHLEGFLKEHHTLNTGFKHIKKHRNIDKLKENNGMFFLFHQSKLKGWHPPFKSPRFWCKIPSLGIMMRH